MSVPEKCIAEVVAAASAQMHDPQYISSQVQQLFVVQPVIAHYLMAHQNELTTEGVVMVLFHASLLCQSVARARGAPLPRIEASVLDSAARQLATVEALATEEPDLASYIASNIGPEEGAERQRLTQRILAHVAGALTR